MPAPLRRIGTLAVSNSCGIQPCPSPAIARPPLNWSSVAYRRATTTGGGGRPAAPPPGLPRGRGGGGEGGGGAAAGGGGGARRPGMTPGGAPPAPAPPTAPATALLGPVPAQAAPATGTEPVYDYTQAIRERLTVET